MIAKISGKFCGRREGCVEIAVGGLVYLVLVPVVVARALEQLALDEPLALETIYYLQMEQARATPVLLGFQNTIQREFFERLLLVPRMGPKGALAAFAQPVSTLAAAIEAADYVALQRLPGVGKQKARDLVATLQGKIARFALMQDADLVGREVAQPHDAGSEALQLLLILGHKRPEAERLVRAALVREPLALDAEALVRVIYSMKQEKPL